nr:hypothetical protein CFP56_10125 [Quercus suber]
MRLTVSTRKDMATEFTVFPQLATELRLEIWRMAMPAPLTRPLYPYNKGCWVVEDHGLEPDPNGEDLHLKFNTSLLDPLRVQLPLYCVNREARDVTLTYIRDHKLEVPQGSSQTAFEFLRHFDPRTDTMFLPLDDIETFLVEQLDRTREPDLDDHYYSTDRPVLPRLAITASGLEILKGELDDFIDTSAPIDALYVIDVPPGSTRTLQELLDASKYNPMDLENAFRAHLMWLSSSREWEVTGDDHVLENMKRLVAGLDDPASSTSAFDLEVALVDINTRGTYASIRIEHSLNWVPGSLSEVPHLSWVMQAIAGMSGLVCIGDSRWSNRNVIEVELKDSGMINDDSGKRGLMLGRPHAPIYFLRILYVYYSAMHLAALRMARQISENQFLLELAHSMPSGLLLRNASCRLAHGTSDLRKSVPVRACTYPHVLVHFLRHPYAELAEMHPAHANERASAAQNPYAEIAKKRPGLANEDARAAQSGTGSE